MISRALSIFFSTFSPLLFLSQVAAASEAMLANGDLIRRAHLFPITSEDEKGAPLLGGKGTYLDVGIHESGSGERKDCKFAAPLRESSVTGEPWAPLHIYSSILISEQGKLPPADKEVYFSGDTKSRNGKDDPSSLTSPLEASLRDSLVLDRVAENPAELEFKIRFVRGALNYDGLVKIEVREINGECKAAAYLCSKKQADGKCMAEGWGQKISKLVAVADVGGYISDQFYRVKDGRKKNDIAALWLHFVNLVKGGTMLEKMALAKKPS